MASNNPDPAALRWDRIASWALVGVGGATLAWLIVFEILHLSGYAYGQSVYSIDAYDEGVYIATGALMAHGYQLFGQIYSAQPPVFPTVLSLVDRVYGTGIDHARWAMLEFGGATLMLVGWLTWLVRGRLAAAGAMVVLAVSPMFLVYSHAVEEELPMTALAVASLAVSLWWLRVRMAEPGSPVDRGIPAIVGVLFGLAVLTKFFALGLLVPLAMVLLLSAEGLGTRKRAALTGMLTTAAAFVAGAGATIGASLLIWGGSEWSQMVGDRVNASAHSAGLGAGSNVHQLLLFAGTDPGLFVLATVGGVTLLLLEWRMGLVIDLWAATTIGMLESYQPLFGHHPVILLAPAAVLAGVAISGIADALQDNVRNALVWAAPPVSRIHARLRLDRVTQAVPLVAAGAIIVYIVLVPKLVMADGKLFVAPQLDQYGAGVRAAAAVVDAKSVNTIIATSDAGICVQADRLCVPQLVDTSYVRIATGSLTTAQAIAAVRASHTNTVVLGRALCPKTLPGFAGWVRAHFHLVKSIPNLQGGCGGVYIR